MLQLPTDWDVSSNLPRAAILIRARQVTAIREAVDLDESKSDKFFSFIINYSIFILAIWADSG